LLQTAKDVANESCFKAAPAIRNGRSCKLRNYAEARGAESRSDFVHKLRIVLKELNETAVWLQLILENSMLPTEKMNLTCRGKRRIVQNHRSLNQNGRRI